MRIFDCFTFYNEIELLQIRLNMLYPYVDYFVLVEANKTQRGDDKPYYFEECDKKQFESFIDKIIVVKVDDLPSVSGKSDFSIEMFQRNAIMRALSLHCFEDDIVIISDLDEIINPHILININTERVCFSHEGNVRSRIQYWGNLISNVDSNMLKRIIAHRAISLREALDFSPIILEQSMFYYFMNYKTSKIWNASVITLYKNMTLPQSLRACAYNRKFPIVKDAGWHFSYLGGVEKIRLKLKSIVDEDGLNDTDLYYNVNDDYIIDCIENGKDIFKRNYSFSLISVDDLGIDNINEIVKCFPELFYRMR